MRFILTLTAAAAAAAILAAAPAGARTTHPVQVTNLRHAIQWHREMTWHYQDEAGVRRTPTEHAERRTTSVPFLRWIEQRWSHRRIRAKHLLTSRMLPFTNDWQTAVRIVQRDWPGTASWMLSCSSHEGGWGLWVPNHQGSGAGGWMQYMASTWASHYDSAVALARLDHLPLPPSGAASWSSALGQAFAAGWGYSHGRSAWSGDPYC